MMRHMKMERRLRKALDRLSPEHREALRLRYLESLPIEEIAARMGISHSSAEQLVREALHRAQAIYVETSDGRDDRDRVIRASGLQHSANILLSGSRNWLDATRSSPVCRSFKRCCRASMTITYSKIFATFYTTFAPSTIP